MSEFVIRFDGAENALDELHEVEIRLRSQEEEVSRIRSSFRTRFNGRDRILNNLKVQIDSLSDLGTDMQIFQDTLETILRLYLDTEDRLTGNLENRHSGRMIDPNMGYAGDSSETSRHGTSTGERIDETMKRDDDLGSLPGVSLAAGAVLGSAAGGAFDGAGEEISDADSLSGGADIDSLPDGTDAGKIEMPGAAAANLEDLSTALPVADGGEIPWRDGTESIDWDNFLSLVPEEAAGLLSSLSIEYLQELFSIFRGVTLPFGDVWFPGPEFIANSAVWGPFFTFIAWYYFQSRCGEAALLKELETQKELSGDGNEESRADFEDANGGENDPDGKLQDGGHEEKYAEEYEKNYGEDYKEGTEDQLGEDSPEHFREESVEETHGENALANKESGNISAAEFPDAAKAGSEPPAEIPDSTPEGGSGGSRGSSSAGFSSSGGGSGTGDYSGIGTAPESALTDLPVSEAAGTADNLPDGMPSEDPTADYISTLLGEKDRFSDDLRKWINDSMKLWGSKAAEKLPGNAVSAASGPAKTAASSLVRAAVVNAGIELAANGAGAVGSIAGAGKGDVFEELDE